MTFKVYGCRRRQLAFSSACGGCYGDRCVTMVMWQGITLKSESWSVVFFPRLSVCVCVLSVCPSGVYIIHWPFSFLVAVFSQCVQLCFPSVGIVVLLRRFQFVFKSKEATVWNVDVNLSLLSIWYHYHCYCLLRCFVQDLAPSSDRGYDTVEWDSNPEPNQGA